MLCFILSSQVVSLPSQSVILEVANFCAAMDTLIDQDGSDCACCTYCAYNALLNPSDHNVPILSNYGLHLIKTLVTNSQSETNKQEIKNGQIGVVALGQETNKIRKCYFA